jgi:hypothetical protein
MHVLPHEVQRRAPARLAEAETYRRSQALVVADVTVAVLDGF